MPSVQPRIIVVQHSLELHEPSNTGAPAARALPNAELRLWGAKDVPFDATGLDSPGTFLLFPEASANPAPSQIKALVVVDASWSQSRRMVQAKALRTLPRLGLQPRAGRRSLRKAPPGGMSTVEALEAALAWLGDEEGARKLHEVHEALIARTLKARGYL